MVAVSLKNTHQRTIKLDTGDREVWTIPEEVRDKDKQTVRVVLIGFGDDGYPGEPGEKSKQASEYTVGKGGEGGLGGEGGRGGKVLPVTLLVDDIDTIEFYNEGRNSVLNCTGYHFTSADGSSSSSGYYDPYSGNIYARPGKDGYRGGKGGDGGQMKPQVVAIPSTDGESIEYKGQMWTGGKGSYNRSISGSAAGINGNIVIFLAGGGGGGAAVGMNGHDGQIGWEPGLPGGKGADTDPVYGDDGGDWSSGGWGADGSDAEEIIVEPGTPIEAYPFGMGGNGGNGGGGGGGAGLQYWYNRPYNYVDGVGPGLDGIGGIGGSGSKGFYGCAVVYW